MSFTTLLPRLQVQIEDAFEFPIIPQAQKDNWQQFLSDLEASIDSPPSEASLEALAVTVQDAAADQEITFTEWQAIAQAGSDVFASMGLTNAELRTLAYDLQDIAEASRLPKEDDLLIGTDGNDLLLGKTGADTLVGTSSNGTGEIDVLIGGGGADTFVLGNAAGTFYDDGFGFTAGLTDYGLIVDFNAASDTIQLQGTAEDYVLGALPETAVIQGTGIYSTADGESPELVGVVMGVEVTDFSTGFVFV